MNNTTVVLRTSSGISVADLHYIINGSLAIFGNAIIILILISNKDYFKRSAYLFGLASGDLINGVALMVSAVLRTGYVNLSPKNSMVSRIYCMYTITPYWIIGNQATSLMLGLIGMERFVAVKFFSWYRSRWTNKLSWITTAAVYLFCLISISVAFYLAATTNGSTNIGCYFISVVGASYNFYNYSVSILAGILANTGTVSSLVLCLFKMKKTHSRSNNNVQSHIKKEWRLTKAMIGMTVCDLSLVVIPNILMFLISSFNINAAKYGLQNVASISPTLLCVKGGLNLICCLIFNPEFRKITIQFVVRKHQQASVVPVDSIPMFHSRGTDRGTSVGCDKHSHNF